MNAITLPTWCYYFIPPLVGAIIGYITNKVAIRMLFRPLKKWHLFGLRIPMTPGVIPSKRKEFADNIAKMVGNHLLTPEIISNAVKETSFTAHFNQVVEIRLASLFDLDIACINSFVPQNLRESYNETIDSFVEILNKSLCHTLQSDQFKKAVIPIVAQGIEHLLKDNGNGTAGDIGEGNSCNIIALLVTEIVSHPFLESSFEKVIQLYVYQLLQEQKSLEDILPDKTEELLFHFLETSTPHFILIFKDLLEKEEIRLLLAHQGGRLVEKFLHSKGSIGSLVNTIVNSRSIEEYINKYLLENEDFFNELVENEKLKKSFAESLKQKARKVLSTPLVEMISADDVDKVDRICSFCAHQVFQMLQAPKSIEQLSESISNSIMIDSDRIIMAKEYLQNTIDNNSNGILQTSIDQFTCFLTNEDGKEAIAKLVKISVTNFFKKPIGRLSDTIHKGLVEKLSSFLSEISVKIVETEAIGLVESLNIKEIIVTRINSLDLRQLENLLLSIMAEQFKYINLLGACIGFLLGCFNLLLM